MSYTLRYSILGMTYRKSFATVNEALKFSVKKIPFDSFLGIDKED
jgi:hypothetical protein